MLSSNKKRRDFNGHLYFKIKQHRLILTAYMFDDPGCINGRHFPTILNGLVWIGSFSKKGFSCKKALAGAVVSGGVGLLAGTIGSKKIIITCLHCSYQ